MQLGSSQRGEWARGGWSQHVSLIRIRIDVAVAVRSLRLSSSLVRALQRLHATRLRVSFGDDVIAEQQSGIDSLTNEITGVRGEAAVGRRLL